MSNTQTRPLKQSTTTNTPGFAVQRLLAFLKRIQVGHLVVEVDGEQWSFSGEQMPELSAVLRLKQPARLLSRLARLGDIGFAEGYIQRDFETDDLAQLVEIGARNFDALSQDLRPGFWARLAHRVQHALRVNHRRNSKRNIAAHYDLGNEFYQLWLDETMTYSSAINLDQYNTLAEAQQAKYQRLLDQLDANPGDEILEIGCGWGGLAEVAAKRGIHTTGITLSEEQLNFARKRAEHGGFADKARFELTDYRDQTGTFDHIISIEMFEAVGMRYWAQYFQILYQRLKPGGRAALQIITIDEKVFETYRREPDFIQLYIFPGGMLPTKTHLNHLAQAQGFSICNQHNFGQDYAETLKLWGQRFDQKTTELEHLGFDENFRRTWRYYLAYCAGGFRAGRIDVVQLILEKPADPS